MTAFWIKSDLCIVTFWTWEDKFEWVHFLDRDAAVIVETTQVTHSTRGALFVRIKKKQPVLISSKCSEPNCFLSTCPTPSRDYYAVTYVCVMTRFELFIPTDGTWLFFPFVGADKPILTRAYHGGIELVFLIRFTINMRSYWFMILMLLVQSVVRTV